MNDEKERLVEEAGNTFAQTRPYIKSDLNLFWKPKPTMKFMYVDKLIRTHDEIKDEVEMWKGEKPSPKISYIQGSLAIF